MPPLACEAGASVADINVASESATNSQASGVAIRHIVGRSDPLTDTEFWELMERCYNLSEGDPLPFKVSANGIKRSMTRNMLLQNPWLVYSKIHNGYFCKHCVIARSRDRLSGLSIVHMNREVAPRVESIIAKFAVSKTRRITS